MISLAIVVALASGVIFFRRQFVQRLWRWLLRRPEPPGGSSGAGASPGARGGGWGGLG